MWDDRLRRSGVAGWISGLPKSRTSPPGGYSQENPRKMIRLFGLWFTRIHLTSDVGWWWLVLFISLQVTLTWAKVIQLIPFYVEKPPWYILLFISELLRYLVKNGQTHLVYRSWRLSSDQLKGRRWFWRYFGKSGIWLTSSIYIYMKIWRCCRKWRNSRARVLKLRKYLFSFSFHWVMVIGGRLGRVGLEWWPGAKV